MSKLDDFLGGSCRYINIREVLTKVSSSMERKHVGNYQRLAGVSLTQMGQGCWSLDMHHLVVLLEMIRDKKGWDLPERLKYGQL